MPEFSRRQAGSQARRLRDLPELAQHVVTVEWHPDRRCEDQAVLLPEHSGLQPVGSLKLVMLRAYLLVRAAMECTCATARYGGPFAYGGVPSHDGSGNLGAGLSALDASGLGAWMVPGAASEIGR
jgi:hypothetical protein